MNDGAGDDGVKIGSALEMDADGDEVDDGGAGACGGGGGGGNGGDDDGYAISDDAVTDAPRSRSSILVSSTDEPYMADEASMGELITDKDEAINEDGAILLVLLSITDRRTDAPRLDG